MQGLHMERCLFGRHEVDIPEMLIEDVHLFTEVFSQHTWDTVLTEAQRKHLKSFMPNFPGAVDEVEKQRTVQLLFAGSTFKFGNPVKQFYKKMRDGAYVPDIAKYARLCHKAKEREYRYQQKVYYGSLLREVLINRRRILEAVHNLPPEETIKFDSINWNHKPASDRSLIDYRVYHKCRQILQEVNDECGQALGSSSDDDEEDVGVHKGQPRMQSSRMQDAGSFLKCNTTSVMDTFAPRPSSESVALSPVTQGLPHTVVKQKRSYHKMLMPDISRESYRTMLCKHKRRKVDHPDHPELNTSELMLEDIIARVHAARKSKPLGMPNKKSKRQMLGDGEISMLPCDKDENVTQLETSSLLSVKTEANETADTHNAVPRTVMPQQTSDHFSNFFDLLKHLICEEHEERITTTRMEEKVRDWQSTDCITAPNHWHSEHANWADLVPSALRFLSGEVLGLSIESFVPLIDFKERLQLWRWIGHGRDSDDELSVLCEFWLTNRQHELVDSSAATSVPPPRMWTDYKVRSTTEDEKLIFQAQERERFNNPHKAFTYRMHGYEAVVGPVKGVFAKDNALSAKDNSLRPRDHALLIKDRPSYVTILTLVHDTAARLPNGEGTRADICELLKDSQFLAPGVSDAQINTVVSGALDRLHYEKDPCVKYDGTRKLWIYRHRSRAEDEFERIHQAQGVAAKAKKKALQKPKPLKMPRIKDKGLELESCGPASSSLFSTPLSTAENPVESAEYKLPSLAAFSTSPAVSAVPKVPSVTSRHVISAVATPTPSLAFPVTHTAVTSLPSSAYKLAETTKAGIAVSSKGKPLTISLVQQEHLKSFSAAVSGSSSVLQSKQMTFSLLQSHLSKTTDAGPRGVLVTSSQTFGSAVSSWPRTVLQTAPPSTTSSSKPVSSHIVLPSSSDLQQQIPGILTLPGSVVRSIGLKPMLMTSSGLAVSTSSRAETSIITPGSDSSEVGIVMMPKSRALPPASGAGGLMTGQLRPIVIGGKPQSTIAGRSVQFIGKPVQLIPSIRTSTHAVQMSASSSNQASSVSTSSVVIRTKITSTPSLVSQILQQQSLATSGLTTRLVPGSVADQFAVGQSQVRPVVQNHLRVGSPAQMRLMGSLGQARFVLPSDQGGIVITQLPSQSGVMGTQMLIQQRAVRPDTAKQLSASGIHPTILNAASKQAANLQLVKALSGLSTDRNKISGSQPTTYLLAAHQVTSSGDSGIKLQLAPGNITATAKPSPVFARIITPTAGLRLPAAVLHNQLSAVQQPVQINTGESSLTTVTVTASRASNVSWTSTDATHPS